MGWAPTNTVRGLCAALGLEFAMVREAGGEGGRLMYPVGPLLPAAPHPPAALQCSHVPRAPCSSGAGLGQDERWKPIRTGQWMSGAVCAGRLLLLDLLGGVSVPWEGENCSCSGH